MKRLSIRVKFFLATVLVACVFIFILSMLNLCFYDDYDLATRKASLGDLYNSVLSSYDGNIDTITSTLDAMENRSAVRLVIVSADDNVLYASSFGFDEDKKHYDDGKQSATDEEALPGGTLPPVAPFDVTDLPDALNERANQMRGTSILVSILSSLDLSALDHSSGPHYSTLTLREGEQYLSLAGSLHVDGQYLIAYVPFALIEQNSSFNLVFLLITGVLSLLICILLGFFISRQLSRPLISMNEVANSMARLDFSKKFEGREKDEIGQLGQSLNRLSSYLEQSIGELQQSNAQLAQEIREKERIDSMRREFIINVSHELKTPIALIQGYAEGLQYGVADNPEDRKFYCDTIADEANHMNKLVMQLLSLSRLEIGTEQTYLEEIDLHELCRESIEKMQVLSDSRGLSIEYEDTHISVRTDGDMLSQVVNNYLSNAVRYTREGGKIRVAAAREDNAVTLSVFNEGDGLPEDELPKIWEKFYRTDRARTRSAGGTGIGLSLVRAIADTLHGDCGAENMAGGILFWFRIPDSPAPSDSNAKSGESEIE